MPRPRRSLYAPRLLLLDLMLLAGACSPAHATLITAQYQLTYTSVSKPPRQPLPVVGSTVPFNISFETSSYRLDETTPSGAAIYLGPGFLYLPSFISVFDAPEGGADRFSYVLGTPYEILFIQYTLTDPTGTALSSNALPTSEELGRFAGGTYRILSEMTDADYAGLITPAAPEPATLASGAVGLGLAGLAAMRRRRRR